MEIGVLLEMVGLVLAVGLVLLAAALGALWKTRQRERWLAALTPLILAAGFVAGYGWLIEFPHAWTDEPWKMGVVTAGIAGVLLTIIQFLPQRGFGLALKGIGLAVVLSLATWLTVRGFARAQVAWYAAAMAGGLLVYMASLLPSLREPRLWAVAPLVLMICGLGAAFVTLYRVDQNTTGRMIVMVTALAGFALVAGIPRPFRGVARGSGIFLAVMFGVMLTFLTRYSLATTLPGWVFPWMSAGPAAVAVSWIPALRKRPWLCALIAAVLALAIIVPAVIVATKIGVANDGSEYE